MSKVESADFGLQAGEADRIRAVLAAHGVVEQALVYGSRARGTHRPGSDLDLVLIGPVSHQEFNQIETELDDLLLPYPLDLSVYSQIENPALLDHIRRVGRSLYSAE
ncbi:nucleotidyltransferase domain-containing protein [Wenzhouxiangella limi]|uniref:Nucleotidyltransferase domain-containing protein n=1 Tax=Wenzhouxiangella limi TaxID=2707351 RepID=A0A845UUQ8_9GAMM|nr:nucleotidyltransferase domain-containing protein [Wenzhouxiangella limi]NDY95237.1 nucleotidyltransferase domain-containing protein [Wenzhouxiangella limi]